MYKNIIIWLLMFPVNFLFCDLFCRIVSPIACLFIKRSDRNDTVKRLGRREVTLPRDNLIPLLSLFQTNDNNCDEWWYGMYNTSGWNKNWTQEDYDKSPFKRWLCRVMWLQRNSGYGFSYSLLSIPRETAPLYEHTVGSKGSGELWFIYQEYEMYFQLRAQVPFVFKTYLDINIGWKAQKDFPRVIYAGRPISFPRGYGK